MRTGTKRWIGMVAGVIALAAATPAVAQEHGMRGHDPEKRIEKVREALDLTAEQVVQVRAIFAEQAEERRALRESDDREGLRALHEETHARLAAVLDDEQRAKLEELREEHEQHRGKHDGNGEGHGGGSHSERHDEG